MYLLVASQVLDELDRWYYHLYGTLEIRSIKKKKTLIDCIIFIYEDLRLILMKDSHFGY